MKLGEAINSIEYSDAEKKRLGEAVQIKGTLPFEVLNSKYKVIDDKDFWRRLQKKFNVTGFRDGNLGARNIVLQRALVQMNKPTSPTQLDAWQLYKRCAIQFIVDDLPELNRLLLTEDLIEADENFTIRIFKSIKDKTILYNIDYDNISTLYEIWGFERVENFDALMMDGGTSPELVRKLIKNETGKIHSELHSAIKKLQWETVEALSSQDNKLNDLSLAVSDIEDRLISLDLSLNSQLSLIKDDLSKKQSEPIINSLEVNSKKETEIDLSAHQVITQLQDRVGQISDALKECQNILDKKPQSKSYTNNSNVSLNPDEILSAWTRSCSLLGYKNISASFLRIILQLIKHSKIVISTKPDPIIDLFKLFPYSQIRYEVVSPIWLSQADWQESYDFINEEADGPRVLVLSDFDVSIQEVALVPALNKFINNSTSINRVILIPSRPIYQETCVRILESSVILEFDDLWFSNKNKLNSISFENTLMGVNSVNTNYLLSHKIVGNPDFERDLKTISTNIGIDLPQRPSQNFINIYSCLEDLPDNEAWRIASEITLLPWVELSRGEAFRKIYEETLKIRLGGF